MPKHVAVPLAWVALSGAILLWFTAIMVDCEHMLASSCDHAIYASWLDLWRLGWIYRYKELIAGLLAATAGLTAFYAVHAQLRESRNVEANRRARSARVAVTAVSSELGRIAVLIASHAVQAEDLNIRALNAARADLGNIEPAAMNVFMTGTHMIEIGLRAALTLQAGQHSPELFQRRDKGLIYSIMLWNYFSQIESILDSSGSFRFMTADGEAVEKQMKAKGLRFDAGTLRMYNLLYEQVADKELLPQDEQPAQPL